MTVISLQPSIVYGPVRSRRLGPSLGVNVLPFGRKMCSFDCLYCQYGRTPVHVCTYDGSASLPSLEEVDQALRTGLAELSTPPGYITFSGNGEPTLHPDFPALVTLITRVRDALCPGARTAILSNSVGSWRPEIRGGLSELDVRIMKLDAATEEMLQIYNRPCPGVTLEQIAEGLRGLDDVVIQALFTRGPRGNAGEDHIRAWLELVGALRPGEVQIYSLDRPAPSEDLLPVSRSDLERLAERGRSLGIPVTAYGPRSGGELPLGRS
jgi:wyosine [tRNA(Phe)-imidazoG37] synthetase (radical SAM superfamily)